MRIFMFAAGFSVVVLASVSNFTLFQGCRADRCGISMRAVVANMRSSDHSLALQVVKVLW